MNQHRTGTRSSAGYHLNSTSRIPVLCSNGHWWRLLHNTGESAEQEGPEKAPIGTPSRCWLSASNQCVSSNRERGAGSVLIHTQLSRSHSRAPLQA